MKSRISVRHLIFSSAMRGAIRAAEKLGRSWPAVMLGLAMLAATVVWLASVASAGSWAWKSWERLFGSPAQSGEAGLAPQSQPDASGTSGLDITSFDDPSAGASTLQGTLGTAINASGEVAGMYSNSMGVVHGFIRTASGVMTNFDAAGAGSSPPSGWVQGTIPTAIDAAGNVTGVYIDSNNAYHGLLRATDGTITEFDAPGASSAANRGTSAMGINDAGQIVGFYTTGSFSTSSVYHGFVRAADGTFTTIDAPGAGSGESPIGRKQGTSPAAINASGEIAGTYVDSNNNRHGFVRSASGAYTTFDPPGSVTSTGSGGGMSGTGVTGIDTAGDIVGEYTDANLVRHGYVRSASGLVTTFDVPGANTTSASGSIGGTFPLGIDPGGNYVVGLYADPNGLNHGFAYSQPLSGSGTFTAITAPNAGTTAANFVSGTGAIGVNASGEVVGGYLDSNNVGHGFVLNLTSQAVVATPTFSPPAGTYASAQSVTISDTTSGVTIYYTTDGTMPSTSSAIYSGPITVSSSETIEAIATASGYSQSAVGIAAYVINLLPVAATPTFTPPGGTYSTAQTVTISDATPGATIYYTTNGVLPTTSSAVYTSPIVVSSSEMLEAIATASGYSPSSVGSSQYTITSSAGGEWTWIGGSSTVNQPGVYGMLGVSAAANVAGARQIAASWTDSSGDVWLFGGWGYDASGILGQLNDIWMFNSSSNRWTWMGGSQTVGPNGGRAGVYGTLGTPASGNIPGGRAAASRWTDGSGNLWLFGGSGYDAIGNQSTLNDLWKFNPSTNEWAWIGGSNTAGQPGVYGTFGTPAVGNIPGSRYGASSWTDSSGNLWLFGGLGAGTGGTQGWLNDLWKFNPSSNQWAWMGGSGTTYQPGHYGSLGLPAAGNIPGSRKFATVWTDSSGNFWLFGGYGDDANSAQGWLNDLWKFNPATNQWAWIGGNNTVGSNGGQPGVYGAMGTPAAGNIPGGRQLGASFVDNSGNLWLFGGEGLDGGGNYGKLNDLWEFNPATGKWAWLGGSSTVGGNGGQPGVYGALGIPAPGNVPGGRGYAASWIDSSGNIWLFGGNGFGANANQGDLNDLWEYQPLAATAPQAATPTFSPSAGAYSAAQSVTISDSTPGAKIYYTTNGTTPSAASTAYSGPIAVSSSETIEAIAAAGGYANSAVAMAQYTINLPAPDFQLSVSPSSLSIARGQSGTAIFTVTPANGFNSAVSFSCSGLPAEATCTFSPTTVTPNGSPVTSTLTVSTTAPTSAFLTPLRSSQRLLYAGLIPFFATLFSFAIFRGRRRLGATFWGVFILLLVSAALTSCGGGGGPSNSGGGNSGTPLGTDTVSVSASASGSGAANHAANLTITITQ